MKSNYFINKTILSSLLCLFFLISLNLKAQDQLKLWSLPPDHQLDFASSSLQPFLSGNYPVTPQKFHNVIYKADGTPWFAIVDYDIVDATGNLIGQLNAGITATNLNYLNSASEVSIVPIPNTIDQFYIICPGFYYVLEMCPIPLLLGHYPLASFPSAAPQQALHYSNGIAVSELIGSGSSSYHLLFLRNISYLYTYKIEQTGITLLLQTAFTGQCLDNDLITEMECITNSNGNIVVAFPLTKGYTGPFDPSMPCFESFEILFYEFNSAGGLVNYNSILPEYSIPWYPGSFFRYMIPKGLEFSPDGKTLYYTAYTTNAGWSGSHIYYVDLSSGINLLSTHDPLINNDVDFAKGMIELGHDGIMYFHGGTRLASLTNPNQPLIATTNFSDNAFIFSNPIPYCHNVPSDIWFRNIYSLPDQIDGFNYDVAIGNTTPLQISPTSPVSSCAGGTVTLDAGFGYSTYSWSSGATTQTINVNQSGTYTVTVTYACTSTATASVTVDFTSPVIDNFVVDDVNCNGGNDGSITANISGGTQPLSFIWSSGQTTSTITGLTSGTYTLTVTDLNGCSATGIAIVNEPSILSLSITGVGSGCTGQNTGTATANVNGGTPTYSYNWSTGATTPQITNLSPGVYTVTVTDQHNCTVISSVTINGLTTPIVSISPSPIATVCQGQSITLYSNVSLPVTYLWSTGATTSQISTSIAGLYSVTVTGSNGCAATAQTTVIINPVPVVTISGSTDLCNGTTLVYNAFPTGNYSYSWSVTGGTDIGQSGNQLAIDWTNLGVGLVTGGTVLVTVTDIGTGCSAVQTISIAACCMLAGATNYQHPVFTNTSMNGTFIINGVCTINGNVDFTGATVFMGPLARIELANNSTLVINNTHILACSYMWNGIIADHFTETIQIRNNSIIEDATKAVIVKNNGVCDITFSRFNKNRIHIYSEFAGSNCIVQNNYFDCLSGSIFNCLIPPFTGQHTSKGIELITSEFTIGLAGNGNSFLNCDIGIESNQSRTFILGNRFDRLFKVAVNAFYDGELHVRDQNQFIQCPEGVITTQKVALVEIRNNTFVNTKRGVFNYKNPYVTIDVMDNHFTDAGYCAIMSTWNLKSQQQFINNTIVSSAQTSPSLGIYVAEPVLDQNSTYLLENNTINNISNGIHCLNLFKPHIQLNDLFVLPVNNSSISTFGIKADNCFNPIINDNVVTSDPVSIQYYWSNGIMTDMSPMSYVVCNNVGNIGRGLWFGGVMPGSTVGGNIMGNCFDQLFLNWNQLGLGNVGCPAGNCPPDGFPWDNEWQGVPYSTAGGHQTYAYNSNDPGTGFTTFHTRAGAPYEPTDNYAIIGSDPCLANVLNSYSDPTLFCQTLRIGSEDEPRDLEIANESIDYSNTLESFKWLSKNYLYFKLKQDSLLLASSSVFENEKDSLELTNIGEFESLRDSINQLPEDSMEFTQVLTLMNMANNVSPQEAIEIYLKLTNQIYLNRLSVPGYSYSNSQWNSINYISGLCPYEFGPAIYSAQIMKAMKDTIVGYYDVCTGLSSVGSRVQTDSHSGKKPLPISMLPNPNFGQWNIDLTGLEDPFQITIEIIDAFGRLADKITVDATSSITYKNGNLYPGVYVCKIRSNGNVLAEERIVILK